MHSTSSAAEHHVCRKTGLVV